MCAQLLNYKNFRKSCMPVLEKAGDHTENFMGLLCARQELQSYLRKGIQLDELWRVARGEIQYKEFSSSQGGDGAVAASPSVPGELVRCQISLPS